MRTPLNKAMTPPNKTEKEYSNKELQKVAEAVSRISGIDPEQRQLCLAEIEKARSAREKAIKEREKSETGEHFDQTIEAERVAKQKEQFFVKRLDIMNYTPRIPEQEYYGYVETIDQIIAKAAEDFRGTVWKAMETIVEARDNYFQLAREADSILDNLDSASNVLQSKYRYKITCFQGMDPLYQEDPSEWERHKVRYVSRGFWSVKGADMIKRRKPVNSNEERPWDRTVCAALDAANEISPQR